MQNVRDRSLAEEWLPSRFSLAIFRMLGLSMALASRRKPSAAVLLEHHREQHPLEAYALSCALVAVPCVHLFVALVAGLRWPWVTAPLLAIVLPPVATLAWDAIVFAVAFLAFGLRRLTGLDVPAIRLQGPAIHSLMIALAACSIAYEWRTAWLGAAWLALVGINAFCAVALRVASERVDRFEREVSQES
ncbi:MAG: hypothetical protein ACSLFQ_03485 [Thermoanaerobaculia bacterium]